MQPKPIVSPPTPLLDTLYQLVNADLKRVDALLLARMKSDVPLIHDIASHIIASGGKRIRPALTLISSQLCGVTNSARPVQLAAAVECIHTATLLHDDVVDESILRRGLPTANEIFGNKSSVLVGDYLFAQAFQLMVADGSLAVLKILSEASAIIAKGEVMQLSTEGEPETEIVHYLQVINAKTAALFAAACEIGAVMAGRAEWEKPLRQFGEDIGMAFQLVDDALDYSANQATLGKTVGDDFREGKMTLPVLLAYQAGNAEEKAFWQRTMGDGEQEEADIGQAMALIERHKSLAATFAMAAEHCAKAKDSLAIFPASPAKSAMLELVDFCLNRAY